MKTIDVEYAIIGAGTAGLGAYSKISRKTDSVVMIQDGPYGTTCARVGCMPSKLLITAADYAHHLTTSEFLSTSSQAELLAFVKQGRPVGHPDNTTGIDMPPKGGNPALTDEQIVDIIAYLRTLEQ